MDSNSDEAIAKPTIETVLERINSLGHDLRGGIQAVTQRN
jgi:hypothetical protein